MMMMKNGKALNALELALRLWMGYVLVSNSGIGLLTPLEDLGLPDQPYRILRAMWDTGFLMHLAKGLELVCGAMIALNFRTPLALILVMPVLVNIYGFHLFLFHGVFTKGLGMLLVWGFLAYRRREVFLPLLRT
jgi:uncharacterized membrane protein YphA (DoxX/SURF4 family)